LILEIIIVVAGVTAVVSSLMAMRLSRTYGDKKTIAIEALSTIWTKHKNITLSLDELVGIWRAANGQVVEKEKEVHYKHPEIQELYERYVRGRTYSNSTSGEVIREILSLLDKEGDCPSVVNTKGEPEGLIAKNTFDALAQIPLYKHALNVAEHMIKAFRNSASMLPKVLITALGHDLGKLPSARSKLYSMGDHPIISITILEGLAGYKELPFRDEISKAILEHHRVTKGLLAEKLKEADHASRRMEMSGVAKEIVSDESSQPEQNIKEQAIAPSAKQEQTTVSSAKQEQAIAPSSEQATAPSLEQATVPSLEQVTVPNESSHSVFAEQASQPDADIFSPATSSEAKDKQSIPKEIPLEWFDSEAFLKELKPYINRLWGERWNAFSMPDGYVYFQTGVIEEVAKKLGKNDPNIALMDTSREMKHSVMFSIIQRLKRDKDAIARGLIKDQYFGGRFVITMTDGKTFDGYFTPFVAEAFGEKVSAFEILKQKKLKKIEKVEPMLNA